MASVSIAVFGGWGGGVAGMFARAMAALLVFAVVAVWRCGGYKCEEGAFVRRAERGVMSTAGAREGPAVGFAVADEGEKLEGGRTRELLACECSRQKASYVCAEGGDCVADVGRGYA